MKREMKGRQGEMKELMWTGRNSEKSLSFHFPRILSDTAFLFFSGFLRDFYVVFSINLSLYLALSLRAS